MTHEKQKLLIGGQLIAARKDLRMSRGQLCRTSDITIPTSQALEKGKTAYTIDALMTYADAVGLKVVLIKKEED